jgi:NAD(P)-dependent dehydrogenase (short-subunit alcohol dehydrogenase family)
MADRVKGKVAIVTGAGSSGPGVGNGMAAAILYAREGAKVLLVDLDADAAGRTKKAIDSEGGTSLVFNGDVSSARDCEAMAAAAIRAFGRIDILHNNAGITGGGGGPVETTEETWDRVLAVNLKSMFLACKYVLPQMARQGGGSIINTSSVGGIRARIGRPNVAYSASKAGIDGLTRDVAVQHAPLGIRCNTIVIGGVNTPRVGTVHPEADLDELLRARAAELPAGRMGDAWDGAYLALFLASDEAKHITGATLPVDGGQSAAIRVAQVKKRA